MMSLGDLMPVYLRQIKTNSGVMTAVPRLFQVLQSIMVVMVMQNKQANDSFKSSHVSGPECDGLQETEHLIMNHVGDNSSDGDPVIYDSYIANDDEGGVHNDPVSSQKLKVDDYDSDKFIYSVIYHKNSRLCIPQSGCQSYVACKSQSKYDFGFFPLTDPVLPLQE